MKHKSTWRIGIALLWVTAVLAFAAGWLPLEADGEGTYEVWAIDQSNTAGTTFGGTLYIYRGSDLVGNPQAAVPEVVDLGGATSAMCLAETGANPVRAHLIAFNAGHSYAVIAFVGSGHVVFMDSATRTPVKCLRMSVGAGGARQAHAAFPAPNNAYVIVANQNGKLLERINTDANGNGTPYEGAGDIAHDLAATLNLATCTTPNGAPCETPGAAPRPNNAVICPIVDRSSTLTFVTFAGGGMLVVDTRSGGAPPPIVAEYDNSVVHPNGCGGMQRGVEADGRMYINSGAGGGNVAEADLYSFQLAAFPTAPAFNLPNTPAPTVVYSFDDVGHDSHGMVLNKVRQQRFLWVTDRAANRMEVVDTWTDTHAGAFSLVNAHSGDPAPDLMDLSPQGSHVFLSLRGPCPLTANIAGVNNAVGSTPGVGVVKVLQGGGSGRLIGVAPINKIDGSIASCAPAGAPASNNRADVHGIAVRVSGGG